MKINFFVLLLCSWFLSIGTTSAQTVVDFKFRIWKNSVTPGNYLGEYTGYTDGTSEYDVSDPLSGQICPGDQLIIKNLTAKDGLQLSFNGGSEKATLALSCTIGYSQPISLLADVCTSGCHAIPLHFPNWNWGADLTLTIPPYDCASTNLVISTGIIGNTTPPNNCGPRWIFIPMNLAPTTSIPNQAICPGDVVSLSLDPDFTYNWHTSNPDGTSPSSTQSYTVDITHIASGCTQTKTFTIQVSNPDADPFSNLTLCYNESLLFTENDFDNLFVGNTTPLKLIFNGTVVFEEGGSNADHIIDAMTYGAGVINVEYVYYNSTTGLTCTKNYTITIHPEIIIDMEDSYGFCDGNFDPICVLPPLTAQIGVTYQWTKAGELGILSTSSCFTPTEYGSYCVTATDAFGCKRTHCFTVYETGVGIPSPKSISFCSLTDNPPAYIGWPSDPFGAVAYGFSWTYTDLDGTTVTIPNTGVLYQVPYLGPGTYTAVVVTPGCSETFTITVVDELQIFNNHSFANFTFTPLMAGQVSCQPLISLLGGVDSWTVTDQFGTTIPTIPYLGGIRFNYTLGIEYQVTLRREVAQDCKVYINQFNWLDAPNRHTKGNTSKRLNDLSNNNVNGISESTTIQAFPNPTTGMVNIRLSDIGTTTSSIQVINAVGKIVVQKEITGQSTIELDLKKEASGVYMVRVIYGDQELTTKIIKD
ncbi:T9SS type A sorting domain-containing protein [Aureispira anguillae]|uniref:T9SS type A sorting domain-containing protein n=1 Tax=Aureispira anguillae TaxID=2864201 RepID=A0A915YJV1_9BACT|nr:T9SS type A sorting domain-containing protein [Aureispira anguillae]BDS14570.1 T9SS type A sorting domain-containing protein [Aureispira anguillae]